MGQSNVKEIHDFQNELKFSENPEHEEFWQFVYKKRFPNMVGNCRCTGNNQNQHLGIDRIIQLSSGKTLRIDEKKRKDDYQDFFLEYKHEGPNYYEIGWIEKDLQVDYIAYAFICRHQCYFLPWEELRIAWSCNKEEWQRKYPSPPPAHNEEYDSYGTPVPIGVLMIALRGPIFVSVNNIKNN